MRDPRAADRQVARNVAVHDRVADAYDARHVEIFNPVEQKRLRGALERALAAVLRSGQPPAALDFGCGSGNLTRHLLALGAGVTSADVSPRFLQLVARRFAPAPPATHLLENGDTSRLPEAAFDLVATYSVLHHIPDYLGAVRAMMRAVKPGGVVYIDHEPTPDYWARPAEHAAFRRAVEPFDWRRFLVPSNYVHKLWRLFDPRHSNEGDIHVWPDDHIEWPLIEAVMREAGFTTVIEDDYLLFRARYREEVHAAHQGPLADTRCMAFRRPL